MAYYLEDLNRVRTLSFEKLGEWKEKYPYSQMVHFLMAKKHQLEGLTDDMNIFHRASFYAVDREHLYSRMTASECEAEDESEWITRAEMQVDIQQVQEEHSERKSVIQDIEEIQIVDEIIEMDKKASTLDVEEDVNLSPFANWLSTLKPLASEVSDQAIVKESSKGKKKKKSKKKDKKNGKLEAKIKSSVIKQDEIVSEPLAIILAQQGHTDKAVKMYKKLSLIFPEKSSFFAAQIEKIINSK